MEFKHWLLLNLQDPNYFPITRADWDVLFGSILWTLWCNRNARIFSTNTCDPGGVLQRSQRLLEESMRARLPVIVEVDCRDAYDMIIHGNPRQLGSSVLPDVMARLACQGSLGYHRYLEPPAAVRDALLRDAARPAVVTVQYSSPVSPFRIKKKRISLRFGVNK
ncbi:hypothetical protein V6N11_023188 [Hibiscus sabdariffa]|uniref:Uncharacterized protein n=1 Tax=Hibiscus sabdariffa TaxID=183260 RepID=A0ABR2TLM8_9ROSI